MHALPRARYLPDHLPALGSRWLILCLCAAVNLQNVLCRFINGRTRSSSSVFALQAAPSAAVEEETQGFPSYPEPEIRDVRLALRKLWLPSILLMPYVSKLCVHL